MCRLASDQGISLFVSGAVKKIKKIKNKKKGKKERKKSNDLEVSDADVLLAYNRHF